MNEETYFEMTFEDLENELGKERKNYSSIWKKYLPISNELDKSRKKMDAMTVAIEKKKLQRYIDNENTLDWTWLLKANNNRQYTKEKKDYADKKMGVLGLALSSQYDRLTKQYRVYVPIKKDTDLLKLEKSINFILPYILIPEDAEEGEQTWQSFDLLGSDMNTGVRYDI